MPQIAEQITSLEQELELRIEWLEKGLKEILDCCDLKNTFMLSSDDTAFAGDVKDIAQASLDGEPTTADEHNAKAKLELEKVNRGLDTMQEDEKLVFEEEHNFSPENTVRISDVNKEIAKEWNRDREKRINKESK